MKADETEEAESPAQAEHISKFAPFKNRVPVKIDIHALEDRMLVRSVESFGRDFAFIRSKVLPVHGSSRRKNTSQLRTRYQTLTRSAASENLKSDHVKAAWEAKEKF